jgi:hypothetical protein
MKYLNALIFSLFIYSYACAQSFAESTPVNYAIQLQTTQAESEPVYYNIQLRESYAESPVAFYQITNQSALVSESEAVNYKIGVQNVNQANVQSESRSTSNTEVPVTNIKNPNTYALIIGNEDYKSYQTNLTSEQNVEFAINDASLFRDVCNKTIGIPSENIIYLENASFVKMRQAIDQLELICKYSTVKPTVIFYYSGHGLPDENTKIPYLIPVDAAGSSLNYAISLSDLYSSLTKFPTEKTIVFIDACFTGEARNAGLVSSRGVKVIPKQEVVKGNLVVFNSSSADQPSKSYKEQQHGLFTYFLIQKIISSKGEVTLGDLDTYLHETVPLKSVLINKGEQVPVTNTSAEIFDNWKDWSFLKKN